MLMNSIKLEQAEITPIKIQLGDIGNNLKIYVLSDMHLGDPHADVPTLKKIVDFIKNTPECYCILLGDILNTALKTSKSDIYTETLNVSQAQKLACELLMPIKDKILAMTPGNHENRVWRETGVDVSLWLAEKLGIQDRYRNEFIALSVSFGKDIDGKPFRLNIAGQHGAYGGGRRLGTALNALEDLDGIIANADLFIRAHTHQQVQGSRKVYMFNQNGNIESKVKYYYNSPSVLNYGGYALDKGYKPTNDDPAYLNVRAVSYRGSNNGKRNTRTERSFKIDKVML